MNRQQIIMNYTVPPSEDDLSVIAQEALDTLPEELLEFCDPLAIQVEEFPDEAIEDEFDLEDSYDLVALYRKGNEISPGVESKIANDDDLIILYRRPLLDMWAETGDSLVDLVRQVMIEELGTNFDFSEDEIEEMAQRHYQSQL